MSVAWKAHYQVVSSKGRGRPKHRKTTRKYEEALTFAKLILQYEDGADVYVQRVEYMARVTADGVETGPALRRA